MITTLTIRNFKCFADQELDFKNLTLLSGLNGMGKSTVLQALLLLRQSYQQGLLPDSGLALNGDFVNIGTARDALFENASEEYIEFGLQFSDKSIANWRFDYHRETDVLALASQPIAVTHFPTGLFNDHFNYVEAERIGPRRFFEMSDYKVKQHEQLGSKGEYATHFLSAFGGSDILNARVAHPDEESHDLKHQVTAWVQETRPGAQIHLTPYANMDVLGLDLSFSQINPFFRLDNFSYQKLKGAGLDDDILKKLRQLQYREFFREDEFINGLKDQIGEKDTQKYQNIILDYAKGKQESNKFRAMNVGFGITYTLSVVVALVAAKPGSLVMLENPEAHLHPKGQAKLGELIALAASGGVQVVVETHSDHILNGIRVATYYSKISPDDIVLHFFESEVKDDIIQVKVINPQIDRNGRIDQWPDGFFDEWDNCLETLLMPTEDI